MIYLEYTVSQNSQVEMLSAFPVDYNLMINCNSEKNNVYRYNGSYTRKANIKATPLSSPLQKNNTTHAVGLCAQVIQVFRDRHGEAPCYQKLTHCAFVDMQAQGW